MRKITIFLLSILLLSTGVLQAQQILKGNVRNSITGEGLPAVSVMVKNSSDGSYTDDKGRFKVTVHREFPLTLVVSSIGYTSQIINVTNAQTVLTLDMQPTSSLGDVVVVSASRTVQKKLASPVTIEQISNKDIINSPQINYLDMLQGVKGVDVTVSSIGFTTITTRGFNTSGNTNFTQLTDGMDNQAPGLNFPLGSAISLTELDVDNLELLSGASSAMYGSRGLNGALVITGKDPFKYQGLSVQVMQGVNHVDNTAHGDPVSASPYYDVALRYAKKVNDKLAFKINVQYTKAHDWVATDSTNKSGPGTKYTDPNYNGANYYGGATSTDITPFLQGALAGDPSLAPIINPLLQSPTNNVARTGYAEYGYLDNNAYLLKTNAELRYKIKPKLEAIFSGTFGTGNIVYTNDTRYQLHGFKVGQYRVELKSDNWFVRAYTTQENSGHTIVAGPTAQYINEAWKTSYNPNTGGGWYTDYTTGLITSLAGGANLINAQLAARAAADQGRPAAGSPLFKHLEDSITNRPITQGGTLFLDRSKLYNAETQYNFSHLIKFAEIIAGLNFRLYDLNSKGTLFPDYTKPIHVREYSAYVQGTKKVADNKLSLSASFRFDKSTLFSDPKVTSRASAVFEVAKDNFIRFSFQNAYSFPSNIQALQNTLNGTNSYSSGGSLYLLNNFYHFNQTPPYTQASVQNYQTYKIADSLVRYPYSDIKPQSTNAFELGYSSLIAKRVLIDVLGYFSTWKNFIGYTNVVTATQGATAPSAFLNPSTYITYNIANNGAQTVNTYGAAASVSVDLGHNYLAKVNYFTDYLHNENNSQVNNFNTPHYHINMDFGNMGFGKKQVWSFYTSMRYKPGYYYVVSGGLSSGTVPTSVVLDAQISYKLLDVHSTIKLGATNLTNKYYSTGVANPNIGGVYYVTYAYNVF